MQLQAGYRYGLEPNEFEASLTRKVNKLFKFHGISNIETSVKEGAIKTVRRQVCVQRRGRHYIRLLDDEAMSELNLHSPRYLQSYHSPVKDETLRYNVLRKLISVIKFPLKEDKEADISRISPSSARTVGLWFV
ncbi:uncharacterized protein LOC122948371 isoform X2 [Acropora millepora]|uniref:uncharacterized protein LOC122948371 isoform X2 n=1 Tax=Acropora millepora TaxID=45264 RepID=UPI001CF18177|nr:uncharacterized protein LOC122948371 isoform X2 [Acropora millepora]